MVPSHREGRVLLFAGVEEGFENQRGVTIAYIDFV
jgi:hypothetical protein